MEQPGNGDDPGGKSRVAQGASEPQQASTPAPASASTSAPDIPRTPDADADLDAGLVDPRCVLGDNDSAYDSDSFISDTTSMNSEVTRYRIENGRQYHGYKDGAYWVRYAPGRDNPAF
jgi:hypothetical protein